MNTLARSFGGEYAGALGAYLADAGEQSLRAAYELGRDAVRRELGILDLAAAHHEALAGAVRRWPGRAESIVGAAGDFFCEAVSAYEMVQRGFREAHEAALAERRQAAMLRQLSNFLADASLAIATPDALREIAQIVAEQARELAGAAVRVVDIVPARGSRAIHAESSDDGGAHGLARGDAPRLSVPLWALGGASLGSIQVAGEPGAPPFSELSEAVLVHLAQMVSATVERVAPDLG